MHNNLHTSPLSFEIGMSIAIFIIALLTVLSTILRILSLCINFITYLVTLIADCSAKGYVTLIARRKRNHIRRKVN